MPLTLYIFNQLEIIQVDFEQLSKNSNPFNKYCVLTNFTLDLKTDKEETSKQWKLQLLLRVAAKRAKFYFFNAFKKQLMNLLSEQLKFFAHLIIKFKKLF